MIVYLAFGEIDHEMRPVIGVEETLEKAVSRCVRTPCTEYGETPYDRFWVELWGVGAPSLTALYEVHIPSQTARKLDG